MTALWITLIILGSLLFIFLSILFICFYITFYSPKRKNPGENDFPVPEGKVYEPYHESMRYWIKEIRKMPYEEHSIQSFDGLTLRGKFYCHKPDAPIELMFPGYRGTAERDLCGGVQRCFKLGHSALIVDQRGGGYSDGHVISFGINESKDCLTWIDYIITRFGSDTKIILTGISMGASTVLLTAGESLPPNVIGALADCGYSSAPEIIKKVIRDMKLPPGILYPFVRMSGIVFGGFDVENADMIASVKRASIPIVFVHGDADDFVPHEMGVLLHQSCSSRKQFLSVNGAGHGLSYLKEPELYLRELTDFWA